MTDSLSHYVLQSALFLEAGFPVHGFTTREGGVSQGVYASWNFSPSTGDAPEVVEENLSLLAARAGLSRSQVYSVHQIHSARVVHVAEVGQVTATEKADALVTGLEDTLVGVKTADCVPVLVADRASRWVGAIHAGWRGVEARIVPDTLALMKANGVGTDCIWAIGPHISADCFQVGPEVAAVFHGFSKPDPKQDGKYLVDLKSVLVDQLLSAGVDESAIDVVEGCTISDPVQRFFSHRASKGACGRMFNFISTQCA